MIRVRETAAAKVRAALRLFCALSAFVLLLALSACGDSSTDNASLAADMGNRSQQTRQGGTLNALAATGFEHLDPGQTYFQFDYIVVYAAHRPLYSFMPNDPAEAVADLAQGPPKISADEKTVTVKIKPGIRFSPPVNRAVTSRDVKYAIERGFSESAPNGYASTYFGALVGAKTTSNVPSIPGIQTPDEQTIVFKLTKPFAGTLVGALSMSLTAPVPEEYARDLDAAHPSRYDTDPTKQAFTGPYMIQSYDPARGVTLVRNPNWDSRTDKRPAYLDKVVIDTGGDPTVNARRVLDGKGMLMLDTPPPSQLRRAYTTKRSQLTFVSAGDHYATINTTVAPFDNVNVRRAVVAITDREAMLLARGGNLVGDPATHLLPPSAPGFAESGGYEGTADFLRKTEGDPQLAAAYMKKAGYKDGKYTGKEKVTIVGSNSEPGPSESQILQRGLERLGFDVTVRSMPQQTVYSKFCGVPASKTQICSTVGWLPDFPDGYAYLYPTFSGKTISPVNNANWAMLDVPSVNDALDHAQLAAPGPEREKAWARANTLITEQAAAIPYIWDKQALLSGRDVRAVAAQWNATWDLSFSSLVAPEPSR
jgi:peptide/nickel transport system substrate-binding protein